MKSKSYCNVASNSASLNFCKIAENLYKQKEKKENRKHRKKNHSSFLKNTLFYACKISNEKSYKLVILTVTGSQFQFLEISSKFMKLSRYRNLI